MSIRSTFEPDALLRDAGRLATARVEAGLGEPQPWRRADELAVRHASARLLRRQVDAAAVLGHDAERLTRGIALVPYLEFNGPFGPSWAAHPLASPAMQVGYKLREPDVTRELAALMGPAAGRQGPRRAISFLRVLTEQAGAELMQCYVTDHIRPTVVAEQPVQAVRRRGDVDDGDRSAGAGNRIDLLFEWPLADGLRNAVVVIEAKLGASVSDGQLLSYRREALRRAKGGPVSLLLLTAWADPAERRYRSWTAVRWFSVLRRWESVLADAGDTDPEFARVRAHLWRFVLATRRAQR